MNVPVRMFLLPVCVTGSAKRGFCFTAMLEYAGIQLRALPIPACLTDYVRSSC
jgi:hypothetical protein